MLEGKGRLAPKRVEMLLTRGERLQELRKRDKQLASVKQVEVIRWRGEEEFVTRHKINALLEFPLPVRGWVPVRFAPA